MEKSQLKFVEVDDSLGPGYIKAIFRQATGTTVGEVFYRYPEGCADMLFKAGQNLEIIDQKYRRTPPDNDTSREELSLNLRELYNPMELAIEVEAHLQRSSLIEYNPNSPPKTLTGRVRLESTQINYLSAYANADFPIDCFDPKELVEAKHRLQEATVLGNIIKNPNIKLEYTGLHQGQDGTLAVFTSAGLVTVRQVTPYPEERDCLTQTAQEYGFKVNERCLRKTIRVRADDLGITLSKIGKTGDLPRVWTDIRFASDHGYGQTFLSLFNPCEVPLKERQKALNALTGAKHQPSHQGLEL